MDIAKLRQGVDTNCPPDKTDRLMWDAADEIERLRDYACHKIGCAALHQMGAKCDCGLSELVGPREVSKP